jgi:type I restriction enzyme R subunit
LKEAIVQAIAFCEEIRVDLEAVKAASGFDKVKAIDDVVEAILVNEETKKQYLSLAGDVAKLFKAILPDPLANELAPDCVVLHVIAQKIQWLDPRPDISAIMKEVEHILDRSIAAEGYVIEEPTEGYERYVDLSEIDFDALAKKFKLGWKRIETERLKGAIARKLKEMVRLNRLRINYLERFQRMIEEYNSGSANVEAFFEWLRKFAEELTEEEQRHVAENLSEEELALFDILMKPEMELTNRDRKKVKKVARQLIETLKKEKLSLDWRKRQQSRAAVRLTIEETLEDLPDLYTSEIYLAKCQATYQHVYESYFGAGSSVYAAV